ncbi:hypothetical protein HGRIS_007062 [Hohenbuehelia grisea]|uniref:Uncharacterized protein n=1 Tax=Hohenbuehelia grisea TaxID=104357 RepID=A0ABR3JB95_9AGAR
MRSIRQVTQNTTSYIQRRFISSVGWVGQAAMAYTSQGNVGVRPLVEASLFRHCAASGLDNAGAETAEIITPGHSGGFHPQEQFHFSFRVRDINGNYIPTRNPYTGMRTLTHHLYLPGVFDKYSLQQSARRAAAQANAVHQVQQLVQQGSSSGSGTTGGV